MASDSVAIVNRTCGLLCGFARIGASKVTY
jgi:hypothetical protein